MLKLQLQNVKTRDILLLHGSRNRKWKLREWKKMEIEMTIKTRLKFDNISRFFLSYLSSALPSKE
jgi:hypothetical protein